MSKHHPDVEVVRIEGESVYNRCEAKNAGAAAVRTEWICFVDCDIVVDPNFLSAVVPELRLGGYFRAHPLIDAGVWGTFIVKREDFERVGGFDEAFEGWGEEDNDMYSTLRAIGVVERRFAAS